MSGISSVRSVWAASTPSRSAVGPVVALPWPGGQGVHQALQFEVGVAQLVGVDEVLGELTREPQHHRGERAGGLLGAQDCSGMIADHAKRQLPQLGFADQPGGRLDGQQQPVLAQQRAREGVIGTDGRVLVDGGVAAGVTGPRRRAGPAGSARVASADRPPCA